MGFWFWENGKQQRAIARYFVAHWCKDIKGCKTIKEAHDLADRTVKLYHLENELDGEKTIDLKEGEVKFIGNGIGLLKEGHNVRFVDKKGNPLKAYDPI